MITEFPEYVTDQVTMTEDKFWDLVSYADWPNRHHRDVSSEYLRLLTREECAEFQKIKGCLWHMLDEFIGADNNPACGGDDSHGDLICHIIGLGREQFYAHLNDYSLIEQRGGAPYNSPDGYLECFAYCIPHDSDYDKKNDFEYFKDFAGRAQADIDELLEETNPAVLETIHSRLVQLGYVMECFKLGKYKLGMEQHTTALKLVKEIQKALQADKTLMKVMGGFSNATTLTHNFLLDFPKYIEWENL